MSERLLRCAIIYALVGICIGLFMSITHDFLIRGVHAHANLVGWVSMAVMALVYKTYPAMAESKLATVQFWAHNIGLPIMLVGIYGVVNILAFGIGCAAIGSLIVAVAFISFAINVWCNTRKK